MREDRKRASTCAILHPGGHAARALCSFGILAAFVIVAMTAHEIVAQHEDAYAEARRQLTGLNVALAEHTARVFAATDFVVGDVAEEIAQQLTPAGGLAPAVVEKLLHDHGNSLPMLASMIYADATGKVIAHSQQGAVAPLSVADRPYFQAQREAPKRGLYIGEPIIGRFSARALITLSRAVVDRDGHFRGVVSAGLSSRYFMEFYRDVANFEGASVVLARKTGGILVHYPDTGLPPPGHDGYLVNSRDIDRYPLFVSIGIEEAVLRARWHQNTLMRILGTLTTLAVMLWLLAMIRQRLRFEAGQALRLAQSEEQFRAMFDRAADALFLHELDGRIVMLNHQACQSLGYHSEELIGRHVAVIDANLRFSQPPAGLKTLMQDIIAGQAVTMETTLRRKDGSTFPVEVNLSSFKMDGRSLILALARDISERRAYQARLEQQANYDMLTALPNRLLFLDRLQSALAAARRNKRALALLFIDLDGFKQINDSLGHAVGDQLLVAAGRRIAGALRETDTVARYGGDEFVVLLPELEHTEDGKGVAAKIAAAFAPAFELAEHTVTVRPSIGIAGYPGDGEDATTLLQHADAAMYRAKEAGRP